jgi:hypothetical protein
MPNDVYKKVFDGLLDTYISLGDSADTVVRFLKKTPDSDTRRKLVAELRSLDKKRLGLLDQIDNLAKPT